MTRRAKFGSTTDDHNLAERMSSDTVVDFSNRGQSWLEMEDAEEMLEMVEKCSNLQILNLSGNIITPDVALSLSKILGTKSGLKVLKLNDMFVTRPESQIVYCLSVICKGLVQAKCFLEELDVSHNALGPNGINALAPLFTSEVLFKLERIFLTNDGISLKSIKILSEFLDKMLRGFMKSNEGLSHPLSMIVINKNRVEARGIELLSSYFKCFPNLVHLDLKHNSIYQSGIIALTKSLTPLTCLQYISLNDNTITEEAAPHLAFIVSHCTKLRHLDIGDCLIRDPGARLMAKAIQHSQPPLNYLDFSFNEIFYVESALSLLDSVSYIFRNFNPEIDGEAPDFFITLDGNFFGKHAIEMITRYSENVGLKKGMLEGFEQDQLPDIGNKTNTEDSIAKLLEKMQINRESE